MPTDYDHTELLKQIDALLEKNKWQESTFGRKVNGNPYLVQRLRNGGDIRTGTLARIKKVLAGE